MSPRAELERAFGQDFLDRPVTSTVGRVNWETACRCGHLQRHHGAGLGGSYRVDEPTEKTVHGVLVTVSKTLDGCCGAARRPGTERETTAFDREAATYTTTVLVTCPCLKFQPLAEIDRPNRMFCQRITDREDYTRHPFAVGVRALMKFLSKRRAALADPDWAWAEFDRRFTWVDRVCGISSCEETADVWPVFVDGDRSELRCPGHR